MFKRIMLTMALLLSFTVMSKASTKKITLSKDNSVAFYGSVTPLIIGGVINDIKRMDSNLKSGYPIYLILNTPGGSIGAGLEFINFVKSLNRPVHTITLFAASMGFQFVQNLGDRYITEYGELMAHSARGGFSGEFGLGGSQLDSRYGLWVRKMLRLDRQTVKRTKGKQTLKSYRKAYENELWLNGWEAVQKGYADAVASITCNSTLKGNRVVELHQKGRTILVTFNACPLLTEILNVQFNISTNRGVMTNSEFIKRGGVYGNDCRRNDEVDTDVYGKAIVSKKELCAIDSRLSKKEIDATINQIRKKFSGIRGQVNKFKMKI